MAETTSNAAAALSTDNGGTTWASRTVPNVGSPNVVLCDSASDCWMSMGEVGEGAILANTDSGGSWVAATVPGSAREFLCNRRCNPSQVRAGARAARR